MKSISSALLLTCALLVGCNRSVKDNVGGRSKVDVDLTLNKLAGLEQSTDFGLYEFISNSKSEDRNSLMRICHGVLLMDDRGVCKFESLRRSNTEPFWVYINLADRILVVFPERKTAYQAPGSLLLEPDSQRALAAYDGIRLVLGLSDVWSNPSQHQVKTKTFSNRLEFQSPGRPFRWDVVVDDSASTAPFSELKAKSGRSTLASLTRKTTSMALYDEQATRRYGAGSDPGGVKIDANLWEVAMEGCSRRNQLQFTPYPKSSIDHEKMGQQLASVTLEKDYKVEDLTVDWIKRWLDLR